MSLFTYLLPCPYLPTYSPYYLFTVSTHTLTVSSTLLTVPTYLLTIPTYLRIVPIAYFHVPTYIVGRHNLILNIYQCELGIQAKS